MAVKANRGRVPVHWPIFGRMKFAYPTGNAFPLFLAPMAGVSEPPFRRICRELGADVLITEFLNSEGLRRRIARVLGGCEFDEIERPVGLQISAADPGRL